MSDAKPHTAAPVAASGGNFLRAGSNELRRQLDRYSLNQKLRQVARERDTAIGALGEKAWDQKIDLTPFADIQNHLQGISARSGELAANAAELESQKAALERARREAVEQGKTRRDAVEAKKRPVDSSLTAARNRHTDTDRARILAQARLAAIATELTAATRPAGAQPAAETAEQRQARLVSEQGVVKERLVAAEAELPGLATQIAQLQAEASGYAAEIAAIVKEQNETTARLDGELGRMRSGLQAASQAQSQVGKERSDLYRKLGQGLFESEIRPEALKEAVQRVVAIDAGRTELERRLQMSAAETQALPQGTMSKFWAAIVGAPLLVIAIAWGASSLLQQQPLGTPATTIAEPANSDPQNEKDRTVLRFIQAGTGSDAQTRNGAVTILKDDILTMGATFDQTYLPILAKILRSSEPDLREAAANAMGMIRPTPSETAALVQLLKDPAAPVAQAARRALEESHDPAALQLLANAAGGK